VSINHQRNPIEFRQAAVPMLFFSPQLLQEALMNFHEGDPVMHWTYGFGQIVHLEERDISGSKTLYYAVQVRDLTIWVPADNKLESRLRAPTTQSKFKQLLAILSSPGEPLPDDRHERKTRLMELLKDGRTESLCRTIRALSTYQKTRSLNDSDQTILKQSRNTLLGEWEYVLSIPHAQAEIEMYRLLSPTMEIEA
jgi:RNA polymerase-interacting CarD/CdnL/TRCF family regulator